MNELEQLRARVHEAQHVLTATYQAIPKLELISDERTATTVPLVLGSLDMADSFLILLALRADRAWVAATALQRVQMEYCLRAAFFAHAATEEELTACRADGVMPKRGKRRIHLMDVAREAAAKMGWDPDRLLNVVEIQQRELSSAVHGGKEILAIYTQHEEWGDITVPWNDLGNHVDNVMVFSQLALAVLISQSPLAEEQLSAATRPCYEAAQAYFDKWGK